MSDLVRFGVAMDRALLGDFDRRIAAQGYENRSEALRDLIRADLTRAAWDEGATVAATLTVVYTAQARELVLRSADSWGDSAGEVVSSLLVRLDGERSLQVMVLRGHASGMSELAGQLGGARGVLACTLTPAAALHDPGEDPAGRRRPGQPADHR